MSGTPIKLANEALSLFLHSLPMGSKFNIVSYGSDYSKLFEESVEYNDENLEYALQQVGQFEADMGGTEIYEPIKDILQKDADPNLPRHLYLLTDGAVGNTQQIVQLIKKNRGACHVHTFGIGVGASTELIKDCARAGFGHYSFIYNLDEIEKKVMESLQKDYLEYLVIREALLLDQNRKIIKALDTENMDISHGSLLSVLYQLPEGVAEAKYFETTIYDPNTDMEVTQTIEIPRND